MDAMTWYTQTTGDDTTNAVATNAGIVYTTLARQLSSGKLTPETLVAIARAYKRDAIDALIAHGIITVDDVRKHATRPTLQSATDREIADEVWRRLNDGEEHGTFDEPLGPQMGPWEVHDGDEALPDDIAAQGQGADIDAEQEGSQDQP